MEGAGKIVAGILVVIAVVVLIIRAIAATIENLTDTFGVVLVSIFGALSACAIIYYFAFHRPMQKAAAFRALPVDAPMKINITTSEYGELHRLHIDVKMSQRDITALEQSGLSHHSLFRYYRLEDGYDVDFYNYYLLQPKTIDFVDIQSLSAAKAQLIDGLHALRTRLDQQKDYTLAQKYGGQQERMEI